MKLLLFLDYDGTLTPIVAKPHLAKLTRSRRAFLKKISRNPEVILTVVSGRQLKDLKKLVGLSGIYYAGNHGFEMIGPKTKTIHPKAKAAIPVLRKIKAELIKRLKGIKGVLVEDKKLTLSLHYRLVKTPQVKKVSRIFKQIVKPYIKSKKIRITSGKKVFEVRPNVNWNKGQAVLWFLKKLAQGKKALPVYIGDDTTDEDAFKALKKRGLTIRVGKQKGSAAKYFIKNVDQVYKLLRILALEI